VRVQRPSWELLTTRHTASRKPIARWRGAFAIVLLTLTALVGTVPASAGDKRDRHLRDQIAAGDDAMPLKVIVTMKARNQAGPDPEAL
jgi:hypothetical protein